MERITKEGLQNAELKNSSIHVRPLQIFADKKRKNYCFISKLISSKINSSQNLKKVYKKSITKKFNEMILKKGSYHIKNILVYQFVINQPNVVNLKLLLSSDSFPLLVIDYIIPTNLYKNNIKAVESSIGSIKKLKWNEK